MELLDEKFLSKLGNVVGKTVKVDYKTATTPARVFVQVDVAKPLVTAVDDVHGRSRVLHLICLNCGKYGHGTAGCEKKKVIKEKEAVNTAEKEARYGPLMLAPKNGRRRRRRTSSEVSQNIESLRKRIQDLPCPSQEIEAEAKLLTSRSYTVSKPPSSRFHEYIFHLVVMDLVLSK